MDKLIVKAPYTGETIKEIPFTTEQEVEASLKNAYQLYQNKKSWLPLHKRIEILEKTLHIVTERQDQFAVEAAQEGGKPLMDSKVEVARAIQGIKIAIETLGHMHGTEIPMGMTASSANRRAWTLRQPVGVVLAISAFNHPFNLIVHQVIPAIAVGCPVLVKPASTTPISCFNLVNVLYEAGLPKDWCQVIMAKVTVVEKVVSDPRISFLTFIGSGKVGWYLRSKLPAGAHCALEHGGAAPVIIEPDAELDKAIPLLTKGGFYHAGQVCVSVQRIFAHKSIAKKIAHGIGDLAKDLIVGDPTDGSTEVGPLIQAQEVDRVAGWVEESRNEGGKILCGGEVLPNQCYAPTVILHPDSNSKVMSHEIFGPVVCVTPYDNFDEAIGLSNSLPLSFQSAVFTQNINKAMSAVEQLEATAVMINDHTAFRVDWMPFGGRKESGLAMGGIGYSMHDMTYEKMAVFNLG